MTQDNLWQIIRYLLLLAFGPLVTKGYLTSDQVATVLGAVGALFTVAWGLYVKFGTKTTTAQAAAKPDVPVVNQGTGTVHN